MADPSLRRLALQMQTMSIRVQSRATCMSSLHRPALPSTRFDSQRYRLSAPTTTTTTTTLRSFTTTARQNDWLTPKRPEKSKSRVGRPRIATGGSIRGTTVVWGDYGLRMKDHDRRVSAKQLKIGEEAIKKRLRGMNYKLYKRVSANIGVYTKGNEVRMGKGKGKFDYWAARIPVSRIIFELKGNLHEQIVKDAFRLAGHKLPGLYEFVRKGDPPVVGITKLGDGVTLQSLKEARRPIEIKETASELVIPPTMTNSPPQTVSSSM